MIQGSRIGEFLSKGADILLPSGMLSTASKTAAAAALLGLAVIAPSGAQAQVAPGYWQTPYGQAQPHAAPTYSAGPALPIPAEGRARDPGTSGYFTFGTERVDARRVNATVAAAMALGTGGRPGVDPAALLALQSRSAEALSRISANDDDNAPIAGPYAYSTQRWLADFARFMPSLGRADLARQIQHRPDGRLEVATRDAYIEIMGMRSDPYISSLIAGADIVANDTRFRQRMGIGPNFAELAVGHHAGTDAMLRLAVAARQNPGIPVAAAIGEGAARDLLALTGLSAVVPPNVGAAQYLATLDNAFRNGMTRYQAVRTVRLPADYRPGTGVEAEAEPPMYAPR